VQNGTVPYALVFIIYRVGTTDDKNNLNPNMRKVLILTLLILGGLKVNAQTSGVMEYQPIPLNGNSNERAEKSLLNSASSIDAYYIDSYTNKPIKIKLKVIENKYGIFIVGCKKLADYSFADLSREPIKASKILPQAPMSEYFEYKAYNTRFQQSVYF
jgi:phosphoribosyl-dephospho-CoA transferase